MKNILIITCLFCLSNSVLQAQEVKSVIDKKPKDKLQIELKGAPAPDVYIDGKKYDLAIIELLDQNKIESVNVIKNEQAIEEYNAPNGVIIITSKKAHPEKLAAGKIETTGEEDPIVFIDGKRASKERLLKMSPKTIESIEVFKGEMAIEKYNSPGGAIIVKTKK